MNGLVLRDVPLAVDYWRPQKCKHVKYFFLSHIHSDHTEGLTSSWQEKIHCSEITRLLAIEKFKIKPDRLIALETGQVRCFPLSETSGETFSVTPIDANHIPGALMFLFEGSFGTILYTGDFRYTSGMFDTVLGTKQIDDLYLDNTYCDPCCVFPSRQEATNQILGIIRQHPEHRIFIGLTKYGKEELVVQIAQTLKEWVIINPGRYKIAQLLGLPNVFSTDLEDGRIFIVDKFAINRNVMDDWNSEWQTIAVIPTCLYFGSENPFQTDRRIFVVSYSDHCSFPELCTFVEKLHPKVIHPIVRRFKGPLSRASASRGDMSVFDKYLNPSPRRGVPVRSSSNTANCTKTNKNYKPLRMPMPKKIWPKRIQFNSPMKDSSTEALRAPVCDCPTSSHSCSDGRSLLQHMQTDEVPSKSTSKKNAKHCSHTSGTCTSTTHSLVPEIRALRDSIQGGVEVRPGHEIPEEEAHKTVLDQTTAATGQMQEETANNHSTTDATGRSQNSAQLQPDPSENMHAEPVVPCVKVKDVTTAERPRLETLNPTMCKDKHLKRAKSEEDFQPSSPPKPRRKLFPGTENRDNGRAGFVNMMDCKVNSGHVDDEQEWRPVISKLIDERMVNFSREQKDMQIDGVTFLLKWKPKNPLQKIVPGQSVPCHQAPQRDNNVGNRVHHC